MAYLYYPGCSLTGTARDYDISTRAMMRGLGIELTEINDWTCCGASAADAVDALLSLSLPARNLALAQQSQDLLDILAPCSACYLNLLKVSRKLKQRPDLRPAIDAVLATEQLKLSGNGPHVRHLLDVMSQDIGAATIANAVNRPLSDLTVAPYYGCQCLRPYPVFDDPETPTTMTDLIAATGASVHRWAQAARCCGAANVNIHAAAGITRIARILDDARGTDVIATVCPMCQINLEAYQKQAATYLGRDVTISIIYLPQLIGLSMNLTPEQLGLDLNLSLTAEFQAKISQVKQSER